MYFTLVISLNTIKFISTNGMIPFYIDYVAEKMGKGLSRTNFVSFLHDNPTLCLFKRERDF